MCTNRCQWANNSFEAYEQYHDLEWGVPTYDDKTFFEFLILEGAQAGLSWSTILKKRAGYRIAFADYAVNVVAKYDEAKIVELINFEGIVRNKLKIRSVINNAKLFIEVQEEFGTFSQYIWSFVNNKVIVGHWESSSQVPVTTLESDALSYNLKKRGFKFVGSTIMYAYLQATGLVNDHTQDCDRYQQILNS
ncbi:MAG: DNA-3-methyladenine glycosylase I [Reichenbachiella sp.]